MVTTVNFDPILKLPAVETLTGLKRARIYQLIADGNFPRQIKLTPGGRASGWLKSEVEQYLAERVAESRDQVAA